MLVEASFDDVAALTCPSSCWWLLLAADQPPAQTPLHLSILDHPTAANHVPDCYFDDLI
jgi:hypothetical protein